MKYLVMNMEDMYGNKAGVFSAVRKLLYCALVARTISKQEAMCMLAQHPLVLCSEKSEPVSLSTSRRIYNQIEAKKDKKLEDTSWVTEYERRTGDSTLCFHHYVTWVMNRKKNRTLKEIVPHYTGSILFCSFPLSETYCYQVLLAYRPWSKSNPLSNKQDKTYQDQSLKFVSSSVCPQTILLAYERAKRGKLQEDKGIYKHEPTSNVDYNQDIEMEIEGLEGDESEAIKMMALHGSNVPDYTWSFPRGYGYDWSKPKLVENCKNLLI
jgi:hypothetical protein